MVMIVNKPQFDVTSLELRIGSAIWVESSDVIWNSKRKNADYERMRKTAALVVETTPLALKLMWCDPSDPNCSYLNVGIEDVVSGKYTLTSMVLKRQPPGNKPSLEELSLKFDR